MAGYEQEGAQRAGHIPGAASIPWSQAVGEDGTFKPAAELLDLYTSKGVLEGDSIIAYCRIGERSAHTWFVLHELLGRERRQELRRLMDRVGQPASACRSRRAEARPGRPARPARTPCAGRPGRPGPGSPGAPSRQAVPITRWPGGSAT